MIHPNRLMGEDHMQLTRRQIYDLVWGKPLNKIAADLGLSDQGLAKACRRFDIAVPPLGYWQKLAYGKPVRQPALDCEQFTEDVEVQITPGVKMRPQRAASPPAAKKIVELEDVQRSEPRTSEPQKSHPVISEVSQEFRSKKRSDDTVYINVGPFTIHTSPGQSDRVVDILSMFLVFTSSLGVNLKKEGTSWKLYASEESIDIKISEGYDRIPHIPTATELRESRMYSWKAIPEFDSVHSGELKLSITNAGHLGVRLNWSDGKRQRLENIIESFTEGVVAAGSAMRARRLEREEWARQAEIRAQEDVRRRRVEEIQRVRLAAAKQQAGKYEEAQALRAYLDVVIERSSSLPLEDRESVDAWIDWAKQTIHDLDPLSRGLPRLMSDDEAYSNSWRYRNQ
jgi:hypothetical protein